MRLSIKTGDILTPSCKISITYLGQTPDCRPRIAGLFNTFLLYKNFNVDHIPHYHLDIYLKLFIINFMKIMLEKKEQNVVQRMGKALRAARIEARQTQDELAARIGLTRWTVAAMENGDAKVSLAAWIKAAALLDFLEGWDSIFKEEQDPFVRYDREQAEKIKIKSRVRK